MVSGDGFMQRKRHHFPLRPGIRFIKIDEIGSSARAVWSSGTVVSRGRVWCERGRNGVHSIWLARQCAKDFHQIWINCLRGRLVGFKQLVGSLVKELGIGTQKFEELFPRAFESRLLH